MKRDARAFVQEYAAATPRELEALAADVARAGRSDLLPLDLTYASLDRLEDYLALVLDGNLKGNKKRTQERAVRYVGATLIEQAGGRWAPDPHDDAAVAVTGLRAVPAAVLLPAHAVSLFAQWRHTGLLRDRAERDDVELQRRAIVELTADLDATLARLRADAAEVSGTDPGPLDGTSALSRYEPALGRVRAAGAPRDLRRRIRQGLAVAIGRLLQAELGPAEWTVEDAPRDVYFGVWHLHGIRLSSILERMNPAAKPDGLRAMIETSIASRRGKEPPRRPPTRPASAHARPPGRIGKWMVLCPASRALSMKAVLEQIALPNAAKARLVRGRVLVLTVAGADGEEVEVQVALTKARVVAAEAAEFAAELGADRPDRDLIATHDARYEITWTLAESERAFDTHHSLALRLADAVGGVALDRVEGRFVDA